MSIEEFSKEERILRMMKRVLTDIAKDTVTPAGHKHPLSENTILGIRDCLSMITAREAELSLEAGRPSKARPRYIDEPASSVVVQFHKAEPKKNGEDE
jgi:hypothetical protein